MLRRRSRTWGLAVLLPLARWRRLGMMIGARTVESSASSHVYQGASNERTGRVGRKDDRTARSPAPAAKHALATQAAPVAVRVADQR